MSVKTINPQAIVALQNAMSKIYWYKDDLRSFLTSVLGDSPLLVRVDWSNYKRNIVQQVIDQMVRHQQRQSLADSRLAHQHLVERYKVRCESYDWKDIERLIEEHAEEVSQRAEETGKQSTLQVEDLLTLHFARYLYDNGYPVHYRPRFGRQEPDLLGESPEPIVVEAKVVTGKYRPGAGRDWIKRGLRALLEYLRLLHSNYGVADGYLVVFRMGDEKRPPMYVFEPDEWTIGPFTIVPIVINVGEVPKDVDPVPITQEAFSKTHAAISGSADWPARAGSAR